MRLTAAVAMAALLFAITGALATAPSPNADKYIVDYWDSE